jgi:hypothetical protein
MPTITIMNRWTGATIWTYEVTDEQQASGLAMRHALEAANGAKVSLSGADLSGADLSGADLSGADLRGAALSGADLSGADLSGADLSGADLRDADLRGAALSGADLRGAALSDADLRDADLRGAALSGADLSGAALSGAALSGADLSGADLSGADLSGADRATDEQSISNLDKVREVVLDDTRRLEMRHWHDEESSWRTKSCAEEMLCGTTHCLAGWLQVCSTDENVRALDPQTAGVVSAPVAAKMFFRSDDEVLDWLRNRQYVDDIEEGNRRSAERKARRAAAPGV